MKEVKVVNVAAMNYFGGQQNTLAKDGEHAAASAYAIAFAVMNAALVLQEVFNVTEANYAAKDGKP